MDNKIEFANT